MTTTPNLGLTLLSANQAQASVLINQAFMILDSLVPATSIISRSTATPPVSPSNGASYIVPSGATGAWSGKANSIATWISSSAAWSFFSPYLGLTVYSLADNCPVVYNGAGTWLPTVGTFTLTTSATSTVVSVPGLLTTSQFLYAPSFGSGSAAAASMYPFLSPASQSAGSVTFNHPSTASTLTYQYRISI